jgi:NitT/TauT family transport system substrate-binding protein
LTKKLIILSLSLIVLFTMLAAGCQKTESASESKTPLKVGTLSMMTVLPLHVAQQDGLFQSQGVNVEIVPFRSQIERETALSAGQIDCIIEDIYSAPVIDKSSDLIKVVGVSPVQSYMFAIIVAKDSQVNTVADLKKVQIASSLGNIIEYATDQMCLKGGLQVSEVTKTSVPSMPLRLEMMNQGKIEAATFSRPLADLAILGGGRIICDDSKESLLASSIMVSSAFLKDRPADVKKFLNAFSLATEKISADPAKYRSLLVNIASISADIADKIEVPKFDKLRLPTQEEYQSKLDWNLEKKNTSKAIPYQDIVASGYLP